MQEVCLQKQTFDLRVELNPENVAPVFLSDAPLEVRLGDRYLYRVRTFDQNGDPTTLTLAEGPEGMTLNPDGLMVWQPDPNQLGDQWVRLVVEDGRGGSATQEFTIEVTTQPVNFPPEITSVPLTAAIAGEEYLFQPTAEDPNNDTLFWSLEQAPMGMTIDPLNGQVHWQPAVEDIGDHDVTVQVLDTYGAGSQLVYSLRVRAVNTPPVILTAPPTTGAVGSTYLYQVGAEDIDQDRLTFTLVGGPDGMTVDANTGLVQWTPVVGQDGTADVEISVSDSLGASVTQVYSIEVADGQPNQLPVITSTPGFFATTGQTYTYQIVAEDPDGDELTFTLLSDQPGMTLDAATGLLEWTPTAGDLGTTLVEVVARDPALGGSIQQFSLTVLEANNAPEINSTPPTNLASGQPFRYDILATDADGDFLTYELVSGPEGFLIDGVGRTFWIPSADQIGENEIEVRVTDTRGAFATQSFTVMVAADTTAPQVVINLSENPVDVGSMVDIRVQAIDNVGVESLVLTVDGVAVPLDANGNARVQLDTVGGFTALATATDAAGNSSTDEVTIFVADPNDVEGPVVAIAIPGDGDSITAPTDVIGTVLDDTLVSYRLLLAEFGSRDFREIASGTENVDNDVLGRLDPTLLQNGSYVLRLEAFDAGGNGNVIEQGVEITGELKLGNFRQEFSDASINLSGIPIEIVRTYDTLDSSKNGDFGFGWSLGIWDSNLTVNLPSSPLEDIGIYTPFEVGTRVYITRPDGVREGFTFDPTIRVLPGFGDNLVTATPRFLADDGVTSTLTSSGGRLLVNQFGQLEAGGRIPWNPLAPDFGGGLVLTTSDGTQFSISGETRSVTAIKTINGDQLSLRQDGVFSDNGTSIKFQRDALGRIHSITDPLGNEASYRYDSAGDLVAFVDLNGNQTTYSYSDVVPHYLQDVTDPLGRETQRLEYDELGRLRRLVDAGGTSVEFLQDPDSQLLTVNDRLGNPTVFVYDQFGNVLREIDSLGGETVFEYDQNGFLTKEVDALGNETTYVNDSQGNVTQSTNANGDSKFFAYNSNSQLTSMTDELGNTTRFEYDDNGNQIRLIDAQGHEATQEFDEEGNLVTYTDRIGGVSRFRYDGKKLTGYTDVSGTDISYIRDANGQFLSETGVITTRDGEVEISNEYQYDNLGRLIGTLNSNGASSQVTYDAAGQLIRSNAPAGGNQSVTYDERGNETSYQSGDESIDIENDANGNPILTTLSTGGIFTNEYDSLGRLVKQTNENGGVATREYDLLGRVVKATNSSGETTEFKYDKVGNLVEERVLESGFVRTYEYDRANRLTGEFVNGDGYRRSLDELGRTVSIEYSDGSSEVFAYDPEGNVVERTTRDGIAWAYTYYPNGEVETITDELGNTTRFTVDSGGNVDSIVDALGRTTSISFNELGEVASKTLPLGQRAEFGYSDAGSPTSQGNFNGLTLGTDYDGKRSPRTSHTPRWKYSCQLGIPGWNSSADLPVWPNGNSC